MSCHNVGHALNSVATGILHYYDMREISFDVAKNLLKIARDGVGFCDGNFPEAVACLDDRCGCCLQQSEVLLGAYDLPAKYKNMQKFMENNIYRDKIVNGQVCPRCLEKLAGITNNN